jgi:transcriptional regulator with XRE-family HTH domain
MPAAAFDAARVLGERVLTERQRVGITQMDVANLAGINVAHYGRIERGMGNPNMETLVRLAGVLGVDPGDFLRGMTVDQLPASRVSYSAADYIRERELRSRR